MNKKDIEDELHRIDKIIWDIRNTDSEFARGRIWVDLYDRFKKLCSFLNYRKVENTSWNDYEIVLDVKDEKCPYCNADLLVGEKEI